MFLPTKSVWAKGNPAVGKGDCVAVDASSSGAEASFYSNADCSSKKKFICEVKMTRNINIAAIKISTRAGASDGD